MEYECLGIFLVKIGPNSILTRCKFYHGILTGTFCHVDIKGWKSIFCYVIHFCCPQERVRAANLWRPLECKGVPNKTQSSNKSAKAMGKNSPSPPTHQGSEKSTKLQIILNQSAKRSRTRLKRVIIFFWPKNIYIGLRLDQSTQK